MSAKEKNGNGGNGGNGDEWDGSLVGQALRGSKTDRTDPVIAGYAARRNQDISARRQRELDELAPEATDDAPDVSADDEDAARVLLPTPLTPEQERQLTRAAEALNYLRRGFEDRHLPLTLGLRAAREAAYQAAWDAGDETARASLKLLTGLPNYRADAYRRRFRAIVLQYFRDHFYAPGEEQAVRNNRRADLTAYLAIGENLEKPADPERGDKPGFLEWYRGSRDEGTRAEHPRRLWPAYRSEVLGHREPKLDRRKEREKEKDALEKRVVEVENANTALQAEISKRDEQIKELTTEEGLAQNVLALGPEAARRVIRLIEAGLKKKKGAA
jgi:hypothetical protein